MTAEVEVFLDVMPGEVRGIVVRGGRFERLIIQRDDDPAQHRLGARAVGRVIESQVAARAAFVDLGCEGRAGFLPLRQGATVRDGERLEVEVTAEPRAGKGPTLRAVGPAVGPARLLSAGPDAAARLALWVPGVAPVGGVAAIRASWDAEEEALASGEVFAEWGLDLAVQRTRALIAVDVDYAHPAGQDPRKGRARANRLGLMQAARMIRLKSWGGLVAIDLAGTTLDQAEVTAMAKQAFAEDGVSIGPLSRFGLLQVALPWTTRPVEETLKDAGGERSSTTRALDVVRRLNQTLLSDTAAPTWVARCHPEEAAMAAPLIARLGPRAVLRPDPAVAPGRSIIEEG